MKDETKMGKNRTGMAMAPRKSAKQNGNSPGGRPAGDPLAFERLRAEYAAGSDGVGTVAPPVTGKGTVRTVMEMGLGRDPYVFLDKLGERLAFERSGTRLYDALIAKHESGDGVVGAADSATLLRFRENEREHFEMLWECLVKLGADPTSQTPSADHAGVKSKGLLETVSDPRTTFYHALDAMLIAELADHEGWRMLIELADGMGQEDMAERFRRAMAQEEIHLETVRRWCTDLVHEEAGLEAATAERP